MSSEPSQSQPQQPPVSAPAPTTTTTQTTLPSELSTQFNSRITEILQNTDLNVVTSKAVRLQLESEFKMDLKPVRKMVDALVMENLERLLESRGDLASPAPPSTTTTTTTTTTAPIAAPPVFVTSSAASTPPPVPQQQQQKSQPQLKVKTESRTQPSRSTNNNNSKKFKSQEIIFDSDDEGDTDGVYNESMSQQEISEKDRQFAEQLQQSEKRSTRPSRSTAAKPTSRKTTTKTTTASTTSRGSGLQQIVLLSPQLVQVTGTEALPRTGVIKALWAYIKENNLQDPADKRFILCDEKLRAIFKKDRISSFGMNKYLSAHMKKPTDVVGGDEIMRKVYGEDCNGYAVSEKKEGSASSPSTPKGKKPAKATKRKAKAAAATTSNRGNVFRRPLILSEALRELFDNKYTELGRPDVVKKIWEYIKSNELQDPADKRFIICDKKLKKVFQGEKRVSAFGMNKYLSDHLTKKESAEEISTTEDDHDEVMEDHEEEGHDHDANAEDAHEMDLDQEEGAAKSEELVKPEPQSA